MISNSKADAPPPDLLYRRFLLGQRVQGVVAQLFAIAFFYLFFPASFVYLFSLFVRSVSVSAFLSWKVVAGFVPFALLLILARWRRFNILSQGFANREVGKVLFSRGDHQLAAVYFQRALDQLSELPKNRLENRPVLRSIRFIREMLAACREAPQDVETNLLQQYVSVVRHGRALDAASLLWVQSRALDTENRWSELEPILDRFLYDFSKPGKSRELAALTAQLGERAYAHGSFQLAVSLLSMAVQSSPHQNENIVLAEAQLGAIELAQGNLVIAAGWAMRALELNRKLDHPTEFSIFHPGEPDKAWRMIETRIDRSLPCPPTAYVLSVVSSIYRSMDLPTMAWPCAINGYLALIQMRSSFPAWRDLFDSILLEIGLIGWQAGQFSVPLLPTEMLTPGLLHSPWSPQPRPEPIRELERLGLSLLTKHYPNTDTLEALGADYANVGHQRSASLQALCDLCLGETSQSVETQIASVPASSEPDPWELSRWALVAQWCGDFRRAAELHDHARRRCWNLPPDRWHTWIILRNAKMLFVMGDKEEYVALCTSWADRAFRQGWTREAYACLDLLLDLNLPADMQAHVDAIGANLLKLLSRDPHFYLEYLRCLFRDACQAYHAEDFGAARQMLGKYLDQMDHLQEEFEAVGFWTYVDPLRMAEAFAILVDCCCQDREMLDQAIEWSERSKLWNIRRNNWRPIVAPVEAQWRYPFVPGDAAGAVA